MVIDYTEQFYVPALRGETEGDDPPTDAALLGAAGPGSVTPA
jgi:hypothetical protein